MKTVKQLALFFEDKPGTLSNYTREKIAQRWTMTLKTSGKLVI
jgi:hypothetical protein